MVNLNSPELLNIKKIKHEIVKELNDKKLTKQANIIGVLDKRPNSSYRDCFGKKGSFVFGHRPSETTESEGGKRGSFISL